MAKLKFDREMANAALDWLFPVGAAIEVRMPEAGRLRTLSGYFNDPEKLLKALESVSGEYTAVYYTINPVDPALLARADNTLEPYAKNTTNDKEIPHRINFLIDADPQRPAGISSIEEQMLDSKRMIAAIKRELAAAGWTIYTHGDMDRHLQKHEDRGTRTRQPAPGQGHAQGQSTGTRTSEKRGWA